MFPLKPEYDRKNDTLEGLTETFLEQGSPFDMPGDFVPDSSLLNPGGGVRWCIVGQQWFRIHTHPRKRMFNPMGVDGGPNVEQIHSTRTTHMFSATALSATPTTNGETRILTRVKG